MLTFDKLYMHCFSNESVICNWCKLCFASGGINFFWCFQWLQIWNFWSC